MSGYKLADGTLVGEAKVGDKFIANEDYLSFKKGDVVTLTVQDGSKCPQFSGSLASHHCYWHRLVRFQPKQFTKSDLKDGMRVVYNNKDKLLVIGGELFRESSSGNYDWVFCLAVYDDNLEWKSNSTCTIDEVYERDGTLLWKREEKSQTEIELEKLQSQISELQEQANKLKATIK